MEDPNHFGRAGFIQGITVALALFSLVISGLAYGETRRQADVAEQGLISGEKNAAYIGFMKHTSQVCRSLDASKGQRPYFLTFNKAQPKVHLRYWSQVNYGQKDAERPQVRERVDELLQSQADADEQINLWFGDDEKMVFDVVSRRNFNMTIESEKPPSVEPQVYFETLAFCYAQLEVLRHWGPTRATVLPQALPLEGDILVEECTQMVPDFAGCTRRNGGSP